MAEDAVRRVVDVPIKSIKVGDRHRSDMGNLQPLAESIATIGLLHPVVLVEGNRLVAGERRIEAFKLLGRKSIPAITVTTLEDATVFLLAERDENTCRKDFAPREGLSIGEAIAKLLNPPAARMAEAGKEGGKKSGKGRSSHNRGSKTFTTPKQDNSKRTAAIAAAAAGVSHQTYHKTKVVDEAAKADPSLEPIAQEMDKTGKVDRAYKKLKAEQKRREDKQAADRAKKALDDKKNTGVYLGDFRELHESIPDESCALIFTDPPYDRDSLELFADLGMLASRVLVDGGSLVTFCGQYVMREVLELVSPEWSMDDIDEGKTDRHEWSYLSGDDKGEKVFNDMHFFWICCCLHTGDTAQMREYGIKVKWKPMLWFVKGDFRRDRNEWIDDLVRSQQEKDKHPWQQSVREAGHFIHALTSPGELIVDPFCGSGTTAYAARNLGRQWWTCDTNPKHVETARKRLQEPIPDLDPFAWIGGV